MTGDSTSPGQLNAQKVKDFANNYFEILYSLGSDQRYCATKSCFMGRLYEALCFDSN